MIPAGHYRAGRLGSVDLAVVHTAETNATASQLAAYFARTDRKVSCHSIVDEHGRVDVLPFSDTAFAAPGANADGDQLEICAYAHMTRVEWLARRGLLEQTARWLAERCRQRRIPPVLLTAADLRAGKRGITGHAQVSEAFHLSTHTDPGKGFPWDTVLARVKVLLTPAGVTPVPVVTAPPYPGHPLTVGSRGTAVTTWQRQMRRRGWKITVDGKFGPESHDVAEAFQQEKRLRYVDGIVGRETWNATWRAPVT